MDGKRSVMELINYSWGRRGPNTSSISASSSEPVSMRELLSLADTQSRELWDNLMLDYSSNKGLPLLRQEVASLYQKIEADNVFIIDANEGVYVGLNATIDHICRTENRQSFHAIVPFPGYQCFNENLKLAGIHLSFWELQYKENKWQINMEQLHNMLRDDTRLLVVNFPHNPTSFTPTEEQWLYLVELCESRNMYLFSDEVFRPSNNDGLDEFASAVELYSKAVSLNGLSKVYGLPGLRIGWLIARSKDIFTGFSRYRDYLSLCPPSPSEILAIIAIRNKDHLKSRNVKVIKSNLELMEDFGNKYKDVIVWSRPRAGTTALVRVQGWLLDLAGGSASKLCDILLQKQDLLVIPATVYNYQDVYIRIGFGRSTFGKGLQEFYKFLQNNRPTDI